MNPIEVKPVSTKYRTIKTKLPVPESIPLFEEMGKYESRSMHGQYPIIWDSASGCVVADPYGNRWIDFTSTIFVANAGHGHPEIIKAIKEQLEKPLLHTYAFCNRPRVELAKKLVKMTPKQFEKAYLVSAGTEATETALKLMRLYGRQKDPKRVGVISFTGSMHGRTMGAEFLKGVPSSSEWIGHDDPNIHHLQIPYPWTVKNFKDADWERKFEEDINSLIAKKVDIKKICGFMVESYIGWSAYFFPKAYIQALAKFAKMNDILLTFDEIQSGFGRTGKLFAFEHYGVDADMVCMGKGMSSSLPLAGVLGPKKVMDIPGVGSMSSTHSSNPLSSAAGLANLNIIENENLVAESARKGKILHDRLGEIQKKYNSRLKYFFGNGLVAAILLFKPGTDEPDGAFATDVFERATHKGLLMVHTGRESIKIGPPLSIPDEALLEGLDVLEEAIAEAEKAAGNSN
ncbi:MAG: aspartate aminotransferase family protein [Deltaproteobacteria bacterium]|nr:aspartate aminotransferase family protein [Deltaproteobacteria bacterium]